MEVCCSSSCPMTICRFERLPPPLLCACHSLSDGLTISQHFLTVLLWEMLQQNVHDLPVTGFVVWGFSVLFCFQLKIQFVHDQPVGKFNFLMLMYSLLPSGTQSCSLPVSGWLGLIFLVSSNNVSLKWPEFFWAGFVFMEFNIKLHFPVWCSGFGVPKKFTKVKTTIYEKCWKRII